MTPKGFGKGQWKPPRRRACFGCGSLDHLQRNCPKNIGQVEEVAVSNVSSRSFEDDDIIVIGMIEEGGKGGVEKTGNVQCDCPRPDTKTRYAFPLVHRQVAP